MATEEVKKSNATRAQKAKATHKEKTAERANDQKTLKAHYLKAKDDVVLLDIIAKIKSFSSYHAKMAKDGVGTRKTGHQLTNGQDEVETVFYTSEKRVSELDKSAGQDEILAYIERQLEMPSGK